MAQNHEQFAVVLAGLRERLRTGLGVRGEPLIVNDLAGALGVSATPVREALAQLAGEGLIEDRRRRGYYAWRVDTSDLEDLYRAQELLTMTALADLTRQTRRAAAPALEGAPTSHMDLAPLSRADDGAEAVLFWEALTWRMAKEAGHRFFLNAQQRLSDRLAPARQLEPAVLDEGRDALAGLAERVNRRDWRALSETLPSFFVRRRAAAGAIIAKLRDEPRS